MNRTPFSLEEGERRLLLWASIAPFAVLGIEAVEREVDFDACCDGAWLRDLVRSGAEGRWLEEWCEVQDELPSERLMVQFLNCCIIVFVT